MSMAGSPAKMGATALDLKKNSSSSSLGTTRRSIVFAYCFTLVFVACTLVFVIHPSPNYRFSSIWFTNTPSHFSILSHFFPNTTSSASFSSRDSIRRSQDFRFPFSRENYRFSGKPNSTSLIGSHNSSPSVYKAKSSVNESAVGTLNGPTKGASENSHATFSREKDGFYGKTNSSPNGSANKPSPSDNQGLNLNGPIKKYSDKSHMNQTSSSHSVPSPNMKGSNSNSTHKSVVLNSSPETVKNASIKEVRETKTMSNHAAVLKKPSDRTNGSFMAGQLQRQRQRKENYWLQLLSHCDIFDGTWEKDDSYPLYAAGSCPQIDEPFDCFLNGRPDSGYEKLRWQPSGCNIPRLNGKNMLELLKGKRLVYVGDSLNRNMWESMVCTLRNSVKDPSKVFEASGRQEYRTEGSYSFLFTDYNCSVEFFRSSFLVREWEMLDTNGSKKETLRLDLVDSSSDRYRSADILVFNTGHWWTHEKTSQGKGYYQEGSHVYDELNVIEAFRKAMTTWGRWIDANINPMKTLVFFRGYSASHFSGGQWNSGGQCDNETLPIKNEAYLSQYPPIMNMLERVMKGMKTHVFYLNVTKMTDFRKDAHPSIYRKKNLTEEERRSPLRFQDCSHWCLPGVPDTWNELVYAQLVVKHNQKQQLQQQEQQQQRRNR